MAESHGGGGSFLLQAARAFALVGIAAIALTVGLGYFAANRAVHRAEQAWAERAESMESFAGRYPPQPDSDAAKALDALTRPLGIQMCGPYVKDETESDKARTKRLQSLASFVGDCGRSGHDRCPALAPEAAELLEQEASRLEAIEAQILEGGPLHWEQDLLKGFAAPVPRLLGHRQLQGLLLGRALEHDARGRSDAAERSLEASWVLNASYGERPELISRLITVAVASLQNGVFRVLKSPADRWRERLQQRSFVAEARVAYQAEAWNLLLHAKGAWGVFDLDEMESGEPRKRSIFESARRFFTVPYVRLSLANASEALLEAFEHMSAQPRCDFDTDAYSKEFEASIPRWNILGRIATPSVVRGFSSMRHTDLDTELAAMVLAARATRRTTGRWPSGPVPSRVCDGIAWQQAAADDASLTIATNAKPFRADDSKWSWSIRLEAK